MRVRNLQRRSNGVFYLRVFIPRDLVPRFGRRELTRSLDTRIRAEGEFLTFLLRLKVRTLFDMARQNASLTPADLQSLAKRYLDWHLEQAEADRLKRRIKDGELLYILDQHQENIEELDRWISKNQLAQADPALKSLLSREGISLDPKSPEYLKLAHYVLRAMRESERIEMERAKGNFNAEVIDDLFKHLSPDINGLPQLVSSPSFADLTTKWLSERQGTWAPKTLVKHTGNINAWQGLIGGHKAVSTITKADVRDARDKLRRLPANWMKKFPGKTAVQVLNNGKPTGIQVIAPASVNAYVMTISSFFGWAEKEGYVTTNPATKLRIDDPVKAKEKRHPFKPKHLTTVFSAPIYTGMKSDFKWMNPGTFHRRDHRFWIPLIGLFSGMRLGEITNLKKEDVRSEAGVLVFDIQQAKTSAGIRLVPVHSQLVQIGFEDYVAASKANELIFPDTSDKSFSKLFGRFLDRLEINDSKLVFHSFRHTFIDALRAAKIQEPIIQAIVGQSRGNVTSQYGHGYPVDVLKDAVEAANHRGLDLGHLKA